MKPESTAKPAADKANSSSASPLTRVEPKQLPALPTRFDPSGRLIAVLDAKQGCWLWDLHAQAYVGQVPAAKCSDWPLAPCVILNTITDDGAAKSADKTAAPADKSNAPADKPKATPDKAKASTDKAGAPTDKAEASTDKTDCSYVPAGERTLRSADGLHVASWTGSKLTVTGGGATNLVQAGCTKKDCADVVAVSFSPDSKQLVFARKAGTRLYLVEPDSGKTAKTLKLGKGEVALPEFVAWGPRGIVAILGLPTAPDDGSGSAEEAPPAAATPEDPASGDAKNSYANLKTIKLALWKPPFTSRQWRDFTEPMSDDSNTSDGTVVLDPLGRYVFKMEDVRRQGTALRVFDIAENHAAKSDLAWHEEVSEVCAVTTTLSEGRWIPGTWPVWETIETSSDDCHDDTENVSAYRLFTAPDKRAVDHVKLKKAPGASEVRVVKEDGKTIATLRGAAAKAAAPAPKGKTDPEKRWMGTGSHSVSRLLDNEEITFEDKHCAHTAAWAFDCPLAVFSRQVFLLEPDPLKAQVVRGGQVAHLFYRPGLAEAFFDGKPVAPDAAIKGSVGLPPRLEKGTINYLDGQTPNLQVTLLAHDGGDGVSGLRVYVDGAPLGDGKPIPIVAEQSTPILLTIPPKTCSQILVHACNGADHVCSEPVEVPFCIKKKHHLK